MKDKMVGLNIKVEASIKEILQKEAEEQDRSVGYIAREILRKYCQEKES